MLRASCTYVQSIFNWRAASCSLTDVLMLVVVEFFDRLLGASCTYVECISTGVPPVAVLLTNSCYVGGVRSGVYLIESLTYRVARRVHRYHARAFMRRPVTNSEHVAPPCSRSDTTPLIDSAATNAGDQLPQSAHPVQLTSRVPLRKERQVSCVRTPRRKRRTSPT
jgi:hypothetical protein